MQKKFLVDTLKIIICTFSNLYGIVSCYKEVQHYATIKTKNKEKQSNDRVIGNVLGDAVVLFMGGGIQLEIYLKNK